MGYYDNRETALQYIEMAEGFDGKELIEVLKNHLPEGSRTLEIGMGPGTDLDILATYYQVTGSDNSQFFLDHYRASHPDADLILLDATELDTERVFDGIYSNKVLHHLSNEELRISLRCQKEILSVKGYVLHSFWRGTGTEEYNGLKCVNQTEASLRQIVGEFFEIGEIGIYQEMEPEDSLFVLAQA